MLSEPENTQGNAPSWNKFKKIQCNRADSINAAIYTHFAQS